MRFAIRLFADQGKVVVEVQRLSGCSYLFHQAAKSVLRSAKGLPAHSPRHTFSIPSSIPRESADDTRKCTEEGLSIAFAQLQQDRRDAHLLAMESLEQLTRATESCSFASKKILSGEHLGSILCLIESKQKGENESLSSMEKRHIASMRRCALTIVANALSLVDPEELQYVLSNRVELSSAPLLSALVTDLLESSECPHEAYQAARCIQALQTSRKIKSQLVGLEANTAISMACVEGAAGHVLLEHESTKLRLQMNI